MTIQEAIPHATLADYEQVWSIFKPHAKTYFPHIRMDYLKRKIEAGEVILQNGVVITYGIYKRKQHIGKLHSVKGDAHIGQIVTQHQGGGVASAALQNFFQHIDANVWLTVRADNARARKFYEKNGMKFMGDISWSGGKLPGAIYMYSGRKLYAQ